jgi:hypothetical protein
VLLRLDHAAPDLACAGEQVEQGLAVAHTDRPLQDRDVLQQPAEHLQHRIAVQ